MAHFQTRLRQPASTKKKKDKKKTQVSCSSAKILEKTEKVANVVVQNVEAWSSSFHKLPFTGLGDNVSFRQEERGLVVTIVTDQVLFVSGEADVQIRGKQILNGIVNALTKIDNNIQIEGHTDSRPISNGRYPSNWELSTSRATNVLRYFVDVEGFPANRISASGYGDTKPLASNDTAEGQSKNRRVELVVLSGVK